MREPVSTEKAPAAIGPYSQAIRAAGLIFTSGQIPIDPATGKMVEGGIKEQTRRVMENLCAVLEAAGTDLSRVVKTTVYLADIEDFSAVNTVYGGFFPADPPARSAFQVAALPLGARVEIEMTALA
ncbi:MAG: RidA family protein [Thermodesulfobacteriota bacterium]